MPRPQPVSAWWWLLPPVAYWIRRRRNDAYQHAVLAVMTPDQVGSIVSYLDHKGRKLIDRFDPQTYRVLAGAMDRHDIGAGRDGPVAALDPLAA